jgi:hypothetical protein
MMREMGRELFALDHLRWRSVAFVECRCPEWRASRPQTFCVGVHGLCNIARAGTKEKEIYSHGKCDCTRSDDLIAIWHPSPFPCGPNRS